MDLELHLRGPAKREQSSQDLSPVCEMGNDKTDKLYCKLSTQHF